MERFAKILRRMGYALILLPVVLDIVFNHFNLSQFFSENHGGAALWYEIVTLPLGVLCLVSGKISMWASSRRGRASGR